MTTSDAPAESPVELLERVRAGWPGGGWEWDGRLGCALSTVTKTQEAQARAALAAGLPFTWTFATLAQAPEAVRSVCARVGGLRADQLVFSATFDDGVVVYCLWWPWGGGANFSARIGATGAALEAVVRSALSVK